MSSIYDKVNAFVQKQMPGRSIYALAKFRDGFLCSVKDSASNQLVIGSMYYIHEANSKLVMDSFPMLANLTEIKKAFDEGRISE